VKERGTAPIVGNTPFGFLSTLLTVFVLMDAEAVSNRKCFYSECVFLAFGEEKRKRRRGERNFLSGQIIVDEKNKMRTKMAGPTILRAGGGGGGWASFVAFCAEERSLSLKPPAGSQ
jgi:hypothetical protein